MMEWEVEQLQATHQSATPSCNQAMVLVLSKLLVSSWGHVGAVQYFASAAAQKDVLSISLAISQKMHMLLVLLFQHVPSLAGCLPANARTFPKQCFLLHFQNLHIVYEYNCCGSIYCKSVGDCKPKKSFPQFLAFSLKKKKSIVPVLNMQYLFIEKEYT